MAAREDPPGPLNILLPTLGSAGDVHPTMALALALQARGHRTTILTYEYFREQIHAAGLEFVQIGTIAEGEKVVTDPRLWDPAKGFECIAQLVIVPNIRRICRAIEERIDTRTVVVASGICLGARVANEKFGVPLATVHLQPAMLRSVHDAGMVGRIPLGPHVPALLKRSFYWMADRFLIDRLITPELNALRAELGLAPVNRLFAGYIHSPHLILGMFPEWFAPRQPDWPMNLHQPGFVLYDAHPQATPSGEVEEFLESGPPPILFTPGSGAATLGDFLRESVEACRIAGLRGTLVTNFPERIPRNLPDGVRGFSYIPFSCILPRCAAMVYAGGIGTMAQTVQAGVPHLVVPHAHDQPDNAARMERLGLGKQIYPEKYRAAAVAEALKSLLKDREIQQRCRTFAHRIDSAAALERSCRLIEGLAAAH